MESYSSRYRLIAVRHCVGVRLVTAERDGYFAQLGEQFIDCRIKAFRLDVLVSNDALRIEQVDGWSLENLPGRLNRAINSTVVPPTPPRDLFFEDGFSVESRRSLSLLTPSNANGFPLNFFTSDRSCGYNSRQGPHQCPQKLSMITLPR